METPTKVAVVILNYNGIHRLKKFLGNVVEKTSNAEVIITDNASTDDSVNYITNNFPSVKLILNKTNEGYAGGYNKALQQISAEYFILLNSDVEVTKNCITPIIELMDSDKSIAACRGRVFETLEEDKGQYEDTSEVFWASGASLFLRSEAFYEVGGFDWDFFAHMEEIDLCWKLKNKGYKIMCEPKSSVFHVGGGTLSSGSTFKTYLNYRNNLLMLYKNLNPKKRFST